MHHLQRSINRARKALQEIHQTYLLVAMSNGDSHYAETMNNMFRLLERLEEEVKE